MKTHCESRPPTKEYKAWGAAKERCFNPSNPRFSDYGGRGIVMCEEWRADYAAFLRDVGRAPTRSHSLDRIDNNRGYEPGNVRWADTLESRRNRRDLTSGLCRNGHALTPDNVYVGHKSRRKCKQCNRLQLRRYKARRQEAA